jgi:hypothetical protein
VSTMVDRDLDTGFPTHLVRCIVNHSLFE